MPREIKFRMWGIEAHYEYNPNTKYDEEENPLPTMVSGDDLAFKECELLCDLLRDTDTQKFMQYTGLHDAQGTEIYEGDIIADDLPGPEYKEIIYGIVFWQDREARFAVQWKRTSEKILKAEHWPVVSLASQAKDIYVVGNIYENPNLLPKEGNGNEGD